MRFQSETRTLFGIALVPLMYILAKNFSTLCLCPEILGG
jgi:hypothetical protein